jgi:hypothetical protein
MSYAFAEQVETEDAAVRNLLRGAAAMMMRTESLVMLSVQGPEVHTAHVATNITTIQETKGRIPVV